MEPIYFLAAVLLWVDSQADIDDNHFEKLQFFEAHTDRFWSRFLIGLMAGLIGFWLEDWLMGVKLGLIVGLIFWAQFDVNLNIRRGMPWYYIGGTSNTDKKFREKLKWYYLSKVVSVALLVYILITLLK